jgi:hypothetical protein
MPLDNWDDPSFGLPDDWRKKEPTTPRRTVTRAPNQAPPPCLERIGSGLSSQSPPACDKPVDIHALAQLPPEELTKHPDMNHMIECSSCRARFKQLTGRQ